MSNESKKDNSGEEGKKPNGFPIQEYKLVPIDYETGTNSEDEIDLIELVKTIWNNRKTIYRFVAVGAVLGVLVALLSPKEYVSSATLMPEYSTESQSGASSLLQQYGGLIGLSGGTYNSSSNAIRVDLYPNIVNSLSFQKKLAEQSFYFAEEDTTVSFFQYFLEVKDPEFFGYLIEYTIGLPGKILGFFANKEEAIASDAESQDIIALTKDEFIIIEYLRERISASLDEESGIISVSAKMSNPELAAKVAKYTIEELTQYLVEYRTEKVLRDLNYIEEQLAKAEERFNEAQLILADFRDSNQGNLTARARTEEERLQSEFNVAGNVYNTLTQQYEEAKLKVQEETPVFKVLQPVSIPVNDEVSGIKIVFTFLFLSFLAALSWTFFKDFIRPKIKNL